MNKCYLSLGSNLGDRLAYLSAAARLLGELAGGSVRISPTYETEAWGMRTQSLFLNQAISVTTNLTARQLLNAAMEAERRLGRTRAAGGPADRVIDIDLLFFNQEVIHEPGLVLPHPRLHLRRFVLAPLSDLAPDLTHPVLRCTVAELLRSCTDPLTVRPLGDGQ